MAPAQPELKKVRHYFIRLYVLCTALTLLQYLDKRLFVQLNGSRKVIGVLRGYDVSTHRTRTSVHTDNDRSS